LITLFSIPKQTTETQYVEVMGKEALGEKWILRFLVGEARGLNACTLSKYFQ
jgi:hypothetical protein